MRGSHLSLSLGEPKEPGRDDDQDKVEDEECKQHPNVSPPIIIPDVQGKEEVLTNGVRAISTSGGIVGVIEVSANGRHELSRPSGARLTLWRVEDGKLLRLALNLESVEFGRDHRTQDASVRIKVV